MTVDCNNLPNNNKMTSTLSSSLSSDNVIEPDIMAVDQTGGKFSAATAGTSAESTNYRWGEVILLDGRSVDLLIPPPLFAGDLFDMVASHFNLKEKEYFGLAFLDETGQYSWLNLDRRVLEHELAQKIRPIRSTIGVNTSARSINAENSMLMPHLMTTGANNTTVSGFTRSAKLIKPTAATLPANLHLHGQVRRPLPNQPISGNARRVSMLKKKSKNATKKQGASLTNLSENLRQKLTGANDMLSRLIQNVTHSASTSSLPQSLTADECAFGSDIGSGSTVAHMRQTSALSYASFNSAVDLNDPMADGKSDDPLYDVINEEDDISPPVPPRKNGHNYHVIGQPPPVIPPSPHNQFSTSSSHHSSHSRLDLSHYLPSLSETQTTTNSTSAQHNYEQLSSIANTKDLDDKMDEEPLEEDRVVLYFLVKYFVESITTLQDTTTIELFFLQAKSLLINEIVQVDFDTGVQLAALILQCTYGNFSSENKVRNRIHKLHLLSSYLLQEQNSAICEDKIIEQYRSLNGVTRGESIYRFMSLIEKQPTYGVHFYEVKDKSAQSYWLGLSFKGINQFDYNDRRLPLRQFSWKQLENLYFREKKFSIEVRDPKRVVHTLSSINLYENAIEDADTFDDLSSAICDPTTQVSVSRRTFGPCNVTVYVWFGSSSALTKCIWSMAISQHQFYIDRHSNKSHCHLARPVEEVIKSLDDKQRRSIVSSHRNSQYGSVNSKLTRRFSSLGSISIGSNQSGSNHSFSCGGLSDTSSSSSGLSLNSYWWDTFDYQQRASIRMSRNNSQANKTLYHRRLRRLETQLNAKLEEIKKLDQLERQILDKACSQSQHTMAYKQTHSTPASIHYQTRILPDETQSSSSSGTSPSLTRSAGSPLSSFSAEPSTNSLKNFVVTGRSHRSTMSFDGSLQNQLPSLAQHIKQPLQPSRQSSLKELLNNTNVQHQRSKSVGVSSKFSVDQRQHNQHLYQQLTSSPQMRTKHQINPTTKTWVPHQVSKPNAPHLMPNCSSLNRQQQATLPHHSQSEPFSQDIHIRKPLPSLTSPYVNKYDTSAETMCVEGGNNLYSVPNRRTSIALNSFDDTFLKPQNNMNKLQQNVIGHHQYLPSHRQLPSQQQQHQQQQQQSQFNNSQVKSDLDRYLISKTSTSVASNVNSVTLSTLTYKYEKQPTEPWSINSSPRLSSHVDAIDNCDGGGSGGGEHLYMSIDSDMYESCVDGNFPTTTTTTSTNSGLSKNSRIRNVPISLSQQGPPSQSRSQSKQPYSSFGSYKHRSDIEENNLAHYRSLLIHNNRVNNEMAQDTAQQLSYANLLPSQSTYANYVNLKPRNVNSVRVSNLEKQQDPKSQTLMSSPSPAPVLPVSSNYYSSASNSSNGTNYVTASGNNRTSNENISTGLYQNLMSNVPCSSATNVYTNISMVSQPKTQKTWLETDLDVYTGNHKPVLSPTPSTMYAPLDAQTDSSNVDALSVADDEVHQHLFGPNGRLAFPERAVSFPQLSRILQYISHNDPAKSTTSSPFADVPHLLERESVVDDCDKLLLEPTDCLVPKSKFRVATCADIKCAGRPKKLGCPIIEIPPYSPTLFPPLSPHKVVHERQPTMEIPFFVPYGTLANSRSKNNSESCQKDDHFDPDSQLDCSHESSFGELEEEMYNDDDDEAEEEEEEEEKKQKNGENVLHFKPEVIETEVDHNEEKGQQSENMNEHHEEVNITKPSVPSTVPLTMSPVCTVAFVPSIVGQDAVGITTNARMGDVNSATTLQSIATCKGNIVEVDVLEVGHIKPGYEEEKPFTLSDFYKYSVRYRNKQPQVNEDSANKVNKPETEENKPVQTQQEQQPPPLSEDKDFTTIAPPMTNRNKTQRPKSTARLVSRFEQLALGQGQGQVSASMRGVNPPPPPSSSSSSSTSVMGRIPSNNHLQRQQQQQQQSSAFTELVIAGVNQHAQQANLANAGTSGSDNNNNNLPAF